MQAPNGTEVPVPDGLAAAIAADAAERDQCNPTDITIEHAVANWWSNSALGIYVPDGCYSEMMIGGSIVVVRSPAGLLSYHTDNVSRFKLAARVKSVEQALSVILTDEDVRRLEGGDLEL